MGGQTDERTDERMENLPILQDFVPYRGRWPKTKNLNMTLNSLLAKWQVSVKSYSLNGNFTRKWRVKRYFFQAWWSVRLVKNFTALLSFSTTVIHLYLTLFHSFIFITHKTGPFTIFGVGPSG